MAWVKVKWIDPLFAALNVVAPARRHDQDGTIGDLAHATGVSGHNPDDTAGVRAEREDADTKQEVRAADGDSRFLQASPTMEDVVQAILRTPAERDRLIYVIYRRRIWRKANGWREERYTGDDPHDTHAHFSGDPAFDEDGRPWTCVLALMEEDDMGQSFGPILLAEDVTFMPLCIPPAGGGAADPRDTWWNAGGDFWDAGAYVPLRVFYSKGTGWAALPGYADGVVLLKSGEVASVQLPTGTRLLSISRWAFDKDGKPIDPADKAAVSKPGNPVSMCFERGPVKPAK